MFQLPREQAYLATGLDGQQTDKLGGDGDGLAVVDGRVTRIRAALPTDQDYEALPRLEREPGPLSADRLAGDAAVDKWQVDPDRLAYALTVKNSANAIRQQFGGSTARAIQVREYASLLLDRLRYWQDLSGQGNFTL